MLYRVEKTSIFSQRHRSASTSTGIFLQFYCGPHDKQLGRTLPVDCNTDKNDAVINHFDRASVRFGHANGPADHLPNPAAITSRIEQAQAC